MSKVTVNCGDWGQSWGLGTNTIGKLSTEDSKIFTWKGHCQGRHGNKWGRGSELIFEVKEGHPVEISSKGTTPNFKAIKEGLRDLEDAIEVVNLKAQQKALKQARQRSKQESNQQSLF